MLTHPVTMLLVGFLAGWITFDRPQWVTDRWIDLKKWIANWWRSR